MRVSIGGLRGRIPLSAWNRRSSSRKADLHIWKGNSLGIEASRQLGELKAVPLIDSWLSQGLRYACCDPEKGSRHAILTWLIVL